MADTSDPVCPIYQVQFVDFGNRERVEATSVRPIDPALQAVPAQAFQANLAYVKVFNAIRYREVLAAILGAKIKEQSIEERRQ